MIWQAASDQYMTPEDFEAIGGLHPHRLDTKNRLQPWRQYLEWKEDLVKRTQITIPYLAWRRENPTCFAFLVRKTDLPDRPLTNVEFDATVPNPLEEDDPELESPSATPRRRRGPRPPDPIRLGMVDRVQPIDPRDPQQTKPWGKMAGPGQVQLLLRVDEDQARKLDKAELPAPGRLLSSIAGELKPLRLQAAGIGRLETSQGFCPRLIDFLFDARNAGAPALLADLAPVAGGRALNLGQQEAVRKALVAPDLCLIQGPPGTGKTTVIAELCLRVALQGGRVLVASQTNLAVDNALSRLADRPAIRRLRLGAAGKVDEEFRDFLADNVIPRWFRTIADQCHRRIEAAEALRAAHQTRDRALAELRAALEAHADAGRAVHDAELRANDLEGSLAAAAQAHEQARLAVDAARVHAAAAHALTAWTAGAAFPGSLPANILIAGHSAAQLAELAAAAAARESLTRLDQVLGAVRLDPSAREVSPEIAMLRRKQRELRDSDVDEDLARLKEVNRSLKKLEESGWLATGRQIRQAANDAFLSGLPACIESLIDALKPEPTLAVELEQAQQIVRARLAAAVAAQAAIAELAGPLAEGARASEQAHALTRTLVDRRAHEVVALRDALAAAQESRAAAAQERDAAGIAWNAAHRLLDPARPAPPITVEALREAAERVVAANTVDDDRLRRASRWRKVQGEWLARLQTITEADRDHLKDLYIRHANVVGMTCNEAGKREHWQSPEWQPFDLVIIDEVSKATPTELLLPMLLGARVVLVGDHRQLAPMFRENRDSFAEAIENGELASADFDRFRKMVTASLFEELYAQAPESIKATLWMQYRMHPQVMHAVNQFYENRLIAGPDELSLDQARQHHLQVAGRNGGRFLEPGQHLLWIDSSEHEGVQRTEEQRGSSKFNGLEVDLVLATLTSLAAALARRGFVGVRERTLDDADARRTMADLAARLLPGAPTETLDELFAERRVRLDGRYQGPEAPGLRGALLRIDARKEVGVLTFYFAQLQDIRRAIDRALAESATLFDALDLRTNTVDRFQGMEKAIVIASLVRATRGRLGDFVREYQRINVGLSRAQQLLVVIGAVETWKRARVPLPPLAGGEAEMRPVYADIFEIA
ncbi:MAG: AAA family ATPase, partial [Myxococcales bacterium]|nr:AAA family ATPase [Myxococcales bacterium]